VAKSLFEEIESHFSTLPIVRSKNVFTTGEYAQNSSLQPRTARERLQRLCNEGVVRKVRTLRDSRITNAWELLS
jgi:transcription initiation factor IIE alpha subunit